MRSTKWNASLIAIVEVERKPNFDLLLSGVDIPVHGYILENPHSCKETKMATSLDFLQGHVTASKLVPWKTRPVNWFRLLGHAIRHVTCERVSRQSELWSVFPCAFGASVGCYTVFIRKTLTVFEI